MNDNSTQEHVELSNLRETGIQDLFSKELTTITDPLPDSMKEFADRLIKQFSDICSEMNKARAEIYQEWKTEHEFDFISSLIGCIELCQKSRYIRCLLEMVNDIATRWDMKLIGRPGHINPSHIFMIIMDDEEGSNSTIFFDHAFPEKQLVCIRLGKNTTSSNWLFVALHEMGHSIGCRNREYREGLFKELAVYRMLNEIYYICCSKKLLLSDDSGFPLQFSMDPEIITNLAMYTIDLRDALHSKYESIYQELDRLYKVATKLISENKPSIDEHYDQYLFPVELRITVAVKEMLENGKAVFISNSDKDIQEDLDDALRKLLADYRIELDGKKDCFHWMEISRLQLSEPAADCFLIKMTDMSFGDYLYHILSVAWYTWNEKKKADSRLKSFCQFVSDDILRMRVLAIAAAKRVGLQSFMIGETEQIIDEKMKSDIIEAAKMLGDMYGETKLHKVKRMELKDMVMEQNILNPQVIISDYAVRIFEDEFYDMFLDENHRYIAEMLHRLKDLK